jgi:hypothetical protein
MLLLTRDLKASRRLAISGSVASYMLFFMRTPLAFEEIFYKE